jgi:hypothetical protein
MLLAFTAALVVASLPLSPSQTTMQVQVEARVVDQDGKPVANAEFADTWAFSAGRWRGSMTCGDAGSKQPLRSDEQGRLRGVWIENPFNQPLLGYSEDRRLVAFAFSNAHPTTHQAELRGELVLVPAVHVVGRLRTTVAPPRGVLAIDVLRAHPEHPAVQRGVLLQLEAPDFSLPLPAGTYRLRLRYGFGSAAWRTFIAPAERTEFDLGPVTVPSKPLDLIGEVLPDWTLDSTGEARVEQISLAKFRGKPLLLAFDEWGGPIVAGARTRPALAALASHPRRSDFAVVLYDTSLRDPQQKAAAVPNGPEVEKLFTVLTPSPHSDANELYGTRWAIAVLDADGRLAHCGREVPDAVAVLERLLR